MQDAFLQVLFFFYLRFVPLKKVQKKYYLTFWEQYSLENKSDTERCPFICYQRRVLAFELADMSHHIMEIANADLQLLCLRHHHLFLTIFDMIMTIV